MLRRGLQGCLRVRRCCSQTLVAEAPLSSYGVLPAHQPLAAEAARVGSGPPAAAAAAATRRRYSAISTHQPSSGGSDEGEGGCPEGASPQAALEAQLAAVERQLATLYTTSDALQQQESALAAEEERLLRQERRLFQEEWLVDQQEAALEAERARLQAQLGVAPSPEPARQVVGQWEGQLHAGGLGSGGGRPAHGLPFLPPVWEDIDAAGSLDQRQVSGLRGGTSASNDSSGYESGDEGGPGMAAPPASAADERAPRYD